MRKPPKLSKKRKKEESQRNTAIFVSKKIRREMESQSNYYPYSGGALFDFDRGDIYKR